MSLFLDFPCSLAGEAKVTAMDWCQVEPICAVLAAGETKLSFYLEEGVALEACSVTRKAVATVVSWQKKAKVLAVGWEDGHLSVYAITSTPTKEGTAAEKAGGGEPRLKNVFSSDGTRGRAAIRVAMWNPSSTRLVTGDASGGVVVWKSDSRGNLTMFKDYSVGSGVTCAVFSSVGIGGGAESSLAQTSNNISPAFFIGTRNGSLYYADDLGHSAEVQALGARVDHLLFYEARDRLVVLTRSLVLVQLQIGEDGKVLPVMKTKVAVAGGAGERGIKSVTWAGPGVVAAATGESLIRFWNLANDETYVISLSSAGLDRSSRVASVAFNPLQRYLAVGTKDGKIAMWRFVGGNNDSMAIADEVSPSASDWEAMPAATACGGLAPIELLSWGPGQGLIAAAAKDGATSLLSETVLHRLLNADVGAIQLSTDSVRLQRQNGASCLLRTELSIRVLNVSSSHLVTSNGHECCVYEWAEEMRDDEPRQIAKFSSTARALVVVRDDTIIRASPTSQNVECCNLNGVVKQKISFSVEEGTPEHLDLNGNFLAVATSTGLLKVFQIDRREPKQLGSPGRFDLFSEHHQTDNEAPKLSQTMKKGKKQQPQQQQLHAMRSIRVNADGTRVSILSDRIYGSSIRIREPETRLYVYDSDRDVVDSHDFGERRRYPISHFWDPREPKLLACETRSLRTAPERKETAKKTNSPKKYNSLGLEHVVKEEEKQIDDTTTEVGRSQVLQKKLLVTQTAFSDTDVAGGNNGGPKSEVATLFVTSDYGMLLQDVFPLEAPLDSLLGVQVPRLFFTRVSSAGKDQDDVEDAMTKPPGVVLNSSSKGTQNNVGLCSRVMRDFIGLDDCDEEARQALLDFSYYLTVGNMDEAHRAVRLIKSPSVWENMAHMCVKTKRLDVAEVCLGHMGHARGAAAVRAAKANTPEIEARMAAVAIQLGLRNDAARLYRECGRYDLLNQLYQAAGVWELALETAARHDRIHLKSTHHRYALHLESLGHYDGAATHFELADTHRREVPRMLVSRGEQAALERYVMRSDDPLLLKWWAGYCESLGHFDSAQHCYESAKDHYNLVRVACFNDNIRLASDIVHESRSKAAAYHLARHLESKHDVNEAIQYFAKSGCYNHAIRLAREYGLDADLLQFAINARPSLQVECAAYFERKGEFEKAVQLYQKGGELAKALDLCFKVGGSNRSQMFEVLATISASLDENTSPAVLARCAEFFIEHGQYADAVKLYITGQRYTQAIALCVERRVEITDDLAEKLTPPKAEKSVEENKDEEPTAARSSKNKRMLSAEERLEVLQELARACKKQNAFQLACKKYTQAGDRARALKCLLKSGDTKNIIYYATVSRHRDIYILAANYLQSLDWQSGSADAAQLTAKIVEFYTKARAHEQLAAFYDAYAQMEIDEYRDYEKAVGALRESKAQLDKAKHKIADRDRRVAALDSRINIVDQFVEARKYEKSDPKRMAEMCTSLLAKRDVDSAIRVGDAFALLVEYHFSVGNAQEAYDLVQQMRKRRIVLHPYIEHDLLSQIHSAVGVELPADEGQASGDVPEDDAAQVDDDIDDDIADDDDNSQEGYPQHK